MSEFTGVFRKNTLPAKPKDAPLSASEKQRLVYLTGQEEDPTQEPDRRFWLGEDPVEQDKRLKERAAKDASIAATKKKDAP